MKTKRVSADTEREIALARRLDTRPRVTRHDEGDHKEAWALAHALSDLEEASRSLALDLIPRIRAEGIEDSEIDNLLVDIGEELRQILYHLKRVKSFAHLGAGEDDN